MGNDKSNQGRWRQGTSDLLPIQKSSQFCFLPDTLVIICTAIFEFCALFFFECVLVFILLIFTSSVIAPLTLGLQLILCCLTISERGILPFL